MTDHTPTPHEVAELVAQRLAAVDMSGFADLFATDAVFEYPFGFPGAPAVVHGREALREHLVESRRDIASLIAVAGVTPTIHETSDPEVAVVELEINGTTLTTGQPFRFHSGVEVMRVRDGEIVEYRDYTNVLGAASITGGSGAVVEALLAEVRA
jgi:ketosteroid isomerase-like protein